MTKSDEETRKYILGLMETLPLELSELVKELRGGVEALRNKADTLDRGLEQVTEDLDKLLVRIAVVEGIVTELCDTASKASAIAPLWGVMKDE